ncbi:hypothetical protein ACU8YH_25855 [Bacillus pretiosus]
MKRQIYNAKRFVGTTPIRKHVFMTYLLILLKYFIYSFMFFVFIDE